MLRGMTHLNVGAAIAMLLWIIWSGVSVVSGERPVKTNAVSALANPSHTKASERAIEEKQP